jgi:hypothetical protein
MAVYRAPFPTPESRRPTWRLLRQDILFIEPPSHQPACASSMVEYTSASFVAGFLLTSALVAIFRDEKRRALRETWFQYRKGPPSSWCCSQYPCCFRANRFPVCVCIGCGTPFFPVGYIDALSSRKNADKICERRSSLSSPQSLQLALRFLAFDNIPARSSSDSCRHLRMSKGYQKVGFNRQLPEYRTP